MPRFKLVLIILLIPSMALQSQTLYMPRDVQNAFNKGTRSPDGRPGKNYWQNYGRYNISVNVTPPDRRVSGREEIIYINNSPDTLRNPVIRLTLNIHRPGSSRNGNVSADYLTDGVHIDEFSVNDKPQSWRDNPFLSTWQPVRLPAPLMPHDSVHLSFKWHYNVSLQSNREGMIDSTTFFLAYFFPRVAVYDDYNGWNRIDFTDQQEFYNDFGDFNLTVNVPSNYLVWATGDLLNPGEVLQPDIAGRFTRSLSSDDIFHLATKETLTAGKVTAQKPVNSWKFRALDVPDAALGLSDHFSWDAGSVIVDDGTGRRASVQAAFNDTAADYHQMVEFGKHALDWFSHHWPGIPYPYSKTTIFQGYAGMEYPMMANDETYEDTRFSRFVAEHEIAHSYMPFYMGINESRYAFMDEGWATTLELLIGIDDLGKATAESLFRQFRVAGWINDASSLQDLPIITPADMLKNEAYGNNAYGKPALGYLAVKDMLGDALFRKCLHAYMDRWHGKHPLPWDFFNTFNNVSGKNLNWFWQNWFFSNGYIDMAIDNIKKTGTGYKVELSNIGGFPAPMDLILSYADGSSDTLHQGPQTWESGEKSVTMTLKTKKQLKSALLDGGIFMDADEGNNRWNEK